jgi:predicted cobalt transporter CbtA
MNHMTETLFSESRPELSPPLSMVDELNAMESRDLGWWGLGWWQAEAIKQANKVELLQLQNDQLRALLAKTTDEVAFNHAKRMCQ